MSCGEQLKYAEIAFTNPGMVYFFGMISVPMPKEAAVCAVMGPILATTAPLIILEMFFSAKSSTKFFTVEELVNVIT
jgi:hypothetical protein